MDDRIDEIMTVVCTVPKRRDWTQHGIEKTLEHRILLRLRSRDGVQGWGEATALAQWGGMLGRYYGETPTTVVHLVHDIFAATLFECELHSPRTVLEQLDTCVVGHPYAKAAVEMALQDIRGKLCGEPLFRLLGGARRSGVRIGHMLGIMDIEDALQEAERSIAADGVTAFQIKGGTDPERDVALITRLRRTFPSGIFLRLDANKGYGRISKELAAIVRRLEEAGVNAIEQPASSRQGLRACREATTIPIIADEGCWTAHDVLELSAEGAVDAISVYVAKAGGMAPAVEVAQTAALLGLRCDINGSLETGIGVAASVHVAMVSETLTLPSIIPVPSTAQRHITKFAGRYWEDDVVDAGYSFRDGHLYLAEGPGLGVAVNETTVMKYAVAKPRVSRP